MDAKELKEKTLREGKFSYLKVVDFIDKLFDTDKNEDKYDVTKEE